MHLLHDFSRMLTSKQSGFAVDIWTIYISHMHIQIQHIHAYACLLHRCNTYIWLFLPLYGLFLRREWLRHQLSAHQIFIVHIIRRLVNIVARFMIVPTASCCRQCRSWRTKEKKNKKSTWNNCCACIFIMHNMFLTMRRIGWKFILISLSLFFSFIGRKRSLFAGAMRWRKLFEYTRWILLSLSTWSSWQALWIGACTMHQITMQWYV